MGWPGRLIASGVAVIAAAAVAAAPAALASGEAPGPRLARGIYLGSGSELHSSDARPPRPQASGSSERQRRIVGGSATTVEAWPWQAGLTRSPARFGGNAYDRQICGGSVVAPTIVITAAHCVYDADVGAFADPQDFSVVTGRTFLSSNEGQEIAVADFYVPLSSGGVPLYDDESSRWDVAVLQLASASSATPIAIAGADERELWTAGRTAFITGWGQLGPGGGFPNGLQAAQVPMIADGACDAPSSWGGLFDEQTMVCAGFLSGGADTCGGDSGGPLVVPTAEGAYRLVGDTSFGGQDCGAPLLVGVYGRLAGDPTRSVLRNAVLSLTGRDIVGSGGQAPEGVGVSPELALELSWTYAERQCDRWIPCRRYWAGSCSAAAAGYSCQVRNLAVNRRGRRSYCRRNVLWSGIGAQVTRQPLGRWKCFHGWPRAT